MSQLDAQLSALEARWHDAGLPRTGVLAPGLPPEVVRTLLHDATGLEPPQDVVTWYAWHDGGLILPAPALAPSWFDFLRLDHAVFQYRGRLNTAREVAQQYDMPLSELWGAVVVPDRG